jgi:hypothetical protein
MLTTTITPSQTPVILLAGRECAGSHDPALDHIAHSVRGNDVHVVAPASPLAGERWLVDVAAREQDARRRLESWTSVLALYASRVDGEVGDENPRLALADARRELGDDAVLMSVSISTASPEVPSVTAARPGWLARRSVTRVLAA